MTAAPHRQRDIDKLDIGKHDIESDGGVTGQPVLPTYDGACVTNIVPALLSGQRELPSWMPRVVAGADQIVLLVLDGLGWLQLQDRRALTPTLSSMEGGVITTVAPSTTATALTSIVTGLTPGEHGVVGYRISVESDVLNVLRWRVSGRDARGAIPPMTFQPIEPFLGQRPPVVSKAEFAGSGFSGAHLEGVRFHPWRVTSTLVTEVGRLARAGEPFIYAYYEGLDKVSHEYGLTEYFDAELRFADRLVADVLEAVPQGTVVMVTADHGQVHVSRAGSLLSDDLWTHVDSQSGEARFRWLHARPGRAGEVLAIAEDLYSDLAWVCPVEEILEAGWFGRKVSDEARSRLGDVALVAREPVAFLDPDDTGPYELIGRHGSLTEDEMLVPLLAAAG